MNFPLHSQPMMNPQFISPLQNIMENQFAKKDGKMQPPLMNLNYEMPSLEKKDIPKMEALSFRPSGYMMPMQPMNFNLMMPKF